MKKVIEILRIIIVSQESLILSILFLLYSFFPDVFSWLSETTSDKKATNWVISAIVFPIFGYSVKKLSDVRSPSIPNKADLYKWGDYWKLKYRIYISFSWSLLCCITAIILFLAEGEISSRLHGVLLSGSLIIILNVSITLWLASGDLDEIMTVANSQE